MGHKIIYTPNGLSTGTLPVIVEVYGYSWVGGLARRRGKSLGSPWVAVWCRVSVLAANFAGGLELVANCAGGLGLAAKCAGGLELAAYCAGA